MSAGLRIGALLRRGWVRAVLAGSVVAALPPAVHAQQNIGCNRFTAAGRVTVGKTRTSAPTRIRQYHGRRSGYRGRQPAHRSLAVHSRQEDRHHASASMTPITSRSAFSTSKCPTTFRGWRRRSPLHRRRHQSIVDQRRILLSGTSPDAATLDKAVQIAGQFGPDPINTVQVMQAAADRARGALH